MSVVIQLIRNQSVQQEVNGTVILPPLVFPALAVQMGYAHRDKTRVQMPAKIFPHLKVKC
jgi:hypothetical protein